MSDIDIAAVDSLKVLDLNRPIREADIDRTALNDRFVPIADIAYSITSSASNCIDVGTTRPSALAVFKLRTNSNLVARVTGTSARQGQRW